MDPAVVAVHHNHEPLSTDTLPPDCLDYTQKPEDSCCLEDSLRWAVDRTLAVRTPLDTR